VKGQRARFLAIPLLLWLALVAGLFLSVGQASSLALAADRYVASGGIDFGDCDLATDPCGTLQYAVDVADPGDVVKVAEGVYDDINGYGGLSQVVYISKTLTIQGGYAAGFAGPPDPEAYPTELDALGQGRVIFATGSGIDVRLEGLRLTGGDAEGLTPGEAGGGFCAEEVHYAQLVDSRIYSNTADIGGGIYVHRSQSSLLDGLQIYDNAAREGGGVYFHLTGNPTLTGSQVFSNNSGWNGAGVYVASGYSDTKLRGNVFHHNDADRGGGAGVFILNTNAPWISGNTVYSNTAGAQGGGLHLDGTRDAMVISNTVHHNEATTNGGGVFVKNADRTILAENEINGNASALTGGGIYVYGSDSLLFEENEVHHNSAPQPGGGVYVGSCQNATLNANVIHHNTSGGGGGLYCYNAIRAQITRNEIYENVGPNGGGIYLYIGGDLWLANNLLWGNEATVTGAGILANKTDAQVVHSTIARHHGTKGQGIALYGGATLTATNTILVSNTVGIVVPGGCTATLEATLWGAGKWVNITDWLADGTLLVGTRNDWADPAFVDPDLGDYHLGPGSAAIDTGVPAGVDEDIDGDLREWCYPDLGADEFPGGKPCQRIYLPVIRRAAP
jgi:nitrous oxidase accessory protein NosD